jgi:hypothetical protein
MTAPLAGAAIAPVGASSAKPAAAANAIISLRMTLLPFGSLRGNQAHGKESLAGKTTCKYVRWCFRQYLRTFILRAAGSVKKFHDPASKSSAFG